MPKKPTWTSELNQMWDLGIGFHLCDQMTFSIFLWLVIRRFTCVSVGHFGRRLRDNNHNAVCNNCIKYVSKHSISVEPKGRKKWKRFSERMKWFTKLIEWNRFGSYSTNKQKTKAVGRKWIFSWWYSTRSNSLSGRTFHQKKHLSNIAYFSRVTID